MPSIGIGFKGTNPDAQKWAAKSAARRVVQINKTTRDGIAALIKRSIREGISPYDTGRLIRPMIGLDERRVAAVMNYRKGLMDAGGSMAVIDKAVERYAAKKLRERAYTISRTEIMSALNEGAAEEARRAIRNGDISADYVKVWLVTEDERLCPVCAPLEDTTVPAAESFPSGDPPIHPACRCTFGLQPGETKTKEVIFGENEITAMKRYQTFDGADAINRMLRRGIIGESELAIKNALPEINALDASFAKTEPVDVSVYRGMSKGGAPPGLFSNMPTITEAELVTAEDLEIAGRRISASLRGIEFVDYGYVSTTTDSELADDYKKWGTKALNPADGIASIFKISGKIRALPINKITGFGVEETLLNRGATFRVESVKVVRLKGVVHLEWDVRVIGEGASR